MTLLAYRHDDAVHRRPAPQSRQRAGPGDRHQPPPPGKHLLAAKRGAAPHTPRRRAQRIAVQFAVRSGVNRRAVFKLLETVLQRGKPAGRCASAEALSQFNGAEANSLAIRALLDPDPQVQARILPQLRNRGIPGAVSKLIELLDSPHDVVRAAARESLAEFSFERFVASYDLLDEDVRRSTGDMVAKVDPTALAALKQELASPSRSRRLRAISMALTMDMVTRIEHALHDALLDEDHLVRAEAARAWPNAIHQKPTPSSARRSPIAASSSARPPKPASRRCIRTSSPSSPFRLRPPGNRRPPHDHSPFPIAPRRSRRAAARHG